jgi:hypothetical protein
MVLVTMAQEGSARVLLVNRMKRTTATNLREPRKEPMEGTHVTNLREPL